MNKIFQGIVLKVVPYKESDAIINILNKDEGIISFKARGVFKINSKNASSLQLYTVGEFNLDSKLDYSNKILKSTNTIYFPLYVYEDLKYSSLLSFLSEVAFIYKDNYKELYEVFETLIFNLNKLDYTTVILLILKYILKWNGVIFEVDSCVECLNDSISAFNYVRGGFLCKKCSNKYHQNIFDLNYLKKIRVVIKANIENIFSYTIEEAYGIKIIYDLFKYIENNLGIYFKSKEMLLMCLKEH